MAEIEPGKEAKKEATPLTGSCQCKAVQYQFTSPIESVFICHCTACQKTTGSSFGISVEVALASLHISGPAPTEPAQLSTVKRMTDSGRGHTGKFCPACGVRIWNASDHALGQGLVYIKGGTLDEGARLDIGKAVHIWTKSKMRGVVIPDGAEQYEEEPPE
jgi:hypothetical protein